MGGGTSMTKVVNCPCGEVVTGETDDEIVADVGQHVEKVHPEKMGARSREQVLDMAFES